MSWPEPTPGLVVRYSYLWRREALLGQEEGRKVRPCAVVLVVLEEGRKPKVRVLPITRTPPNDPADALELPPLTKQRLGLDDDRSWIVLSEANDFLWPGPDLHFRPGQGPASTAIGHLPPGLMKLLLARLHVRRRERRLLISTRTE